MDVRMPPGWDGIETISRIWQQFPYTEMVICTAYSDYAWDDIVARLGNTDKLLFLSKPFDAIAVKQMALTLIKKWNLGQQARNYIESLETEVDQRTKQLKEIMLELEKKNKALEKVALHDPLTGLSNRLLFNDRLQYSINIAARENTTFATAILDLDRFKQINDNLGHLVGDEVLKVISNRLTKTLRSSDTIARLGGDEFALILPNIDQHGIERVADKLESAMESPIFVGEHELFVSMSTGFALHPDHGQLAEDLLKHADAAMYNAKRSGAHYSLYNKQGAEQQLNNIKLVGDLEAAIRENKLTLAYQPIIDAASSRICAVEALSRWVHPELGFIPPDKFIPLAEQKGLIDLLTMWVFDQACQQCSDLQRQGFPLYVSVNLSTRNVLDPKLPEKLAKIMDKRSVSTQWMQIEITESATIHDPERAHTVLQTLDNMGLKISIDDFGTGYSSLSLLKKLPFSEVKIDKSFVFDLDENRESEAIVRSTIELAHTLGLKVVAEGVENENVLSSLAQIGCDKIQGYHVSKPLTSESLADWLRESKWAFTEFDRKRTAETID
jgi:diguanylate cyclase (GGDEF)-like protein